MLQRDTVSDLIQGSDIEGKRFSSEAAIQGVDPNWWERTNAERALRSSLSAFFYRDAALLAEDPSFDAIIRPSRASTKLAVRSIVAQHEGGEVTSSVKEVFQVVKEAQLSFFLDEVTSAFCRDTPLSVEEFAGRTRTLFVTDRVYQEWLRIYEELLDLYQRDSMKRLETVNPEDVFLEYHRLNVIRPDWTVSEPTSEERMVHALRRLRQAVARNEVFRTMGPKRGRDISADILLLRLPFIDLVIVDKGNDQLSNFRSTRSDQGDDASDASMVQQLEALFPGEAVVTERSIDHRWMIAWGPKYTIPGSDEERRELLCEDLAHLRHEIRHVFDKLVGTWKSNVMGAYFPEGVYPQGDRGECSAEEAVLVEDECLVAEFKALCLDGRQLSIKKYLNESIERIRAYAQIGVQDGERIRLFTAPWQELLAILEDHRSFFEELSSVTSQEARRATLLLYHCVALVKSSDELPRRMLLAMEWLKASYARRDSQSV